MEGGRGYGSYSGRGGGGRRGGGRSYGRGGRNGGGRDQSYQTQYSESGGRGGRGRGYDNRAPAGGHDQSYQTRYSESGGRGGRGRGYDNRAPAPQQQQSGGGGGSVGRGVWRGKQWGPSASSSSSTDQPQHQVGGQPLNQTQTPQQSPKHWGPSLSSSSSTDQSQSQSEATRQSQSEASRNQTQTTQQSPPGADSVEHSFSSLKIAEGKRLLSPPENVENKILPMRRPDEGTLAVRSLNLVANHFPVRFNPRKIITHYDVDIKQVAPAGNRSFKKPIPKHLLRAIKDKLFSDYPKDFPSVDMVAYDGEKNIFSAVRLPTGEFKLDFSDAEDTTACSYTFTIKEVSRLELSKLKEYLGGTISCIPRDILQGLDLVMKENPSKYRISVGKSFYCKNYRERDDLRCGIAAYRGFNHSLKSTSQGLALCLDYSVLALRKPWPVLDFLTEYIVDFRGVNDVIARREEVIDALQGLKVTVTHRITKQKYTVSGLTKEITRRLSFQRLGPDSSTPAEEIRLVDYFWEKYEKRIRYLDIPCLDIGRPGKPNHVPMEFCVLVEGQRYPKEHLDVDSAKFLKSISLAHPAERQKTIYEMVQARDGPCGNVTKNFDLEVAKNMTLVPGRVLGAPRLKLREESNGNICNVRVEQEKCQWNLVGKSVVTGQRVERWALIDFTSTSRYRLHVPEFIRKLKNRSLRLGMHMEDPLYCEPCGMNELSSVARIEKLFERVMAGAKRSGRLQDKQLQLIVCVMTSKDPGYKTLKWVSEVQIGVITQCCLSGNASKGQDQYLANLCLKINAKVGGSNVELVERLPHFADQDYVMFIGADVNHPAASNTTCPSIAAVVGSINWPAANRYAARIQPQDHRKEKIVNFGSICRDLVKNFAEHNNCKPKKIVVFRDGVSEGQFDMVLNEELLDLVNAISDEHYRPTITLVVAQKRHHTRLFVDNAGRVGNVPPGTVVDTTIVHPFEFDFYLCSHYGSLGTSKPTHYYVLWDENGFTSDELQKLIYDMCFTYARCTKPVSLVPPVYYADLVAFRGRMYQEVLMEQSPASYRKSVASSSSSTASFDQKFYTLHPQLRNVMHFV